MAVVAAAAAAAAAVVAVVAAAAYVVAVGEEAATREVETTEEELQSTLNWIKIVAVVAFVVVNLWVMQATQAIVGIQQHSFLECLTK